MRVIGTAVLACVSLLACSCSSLTQSPGSLTAASRTREAWFEAAREGYTETILAMLRAGFDVNTQDPEQWNALHLATRCHHKDLVGMLIDAGAILNPTNETGALHEAVQWEGHDGVIELLIARGANVNARGYDGETPLHCAALGNITATEILLAKGASANVADINGQRPLHWAAKAGCAPTANVLIDAGADVNAMDNQTCTALHTAAWWGKTLIVELLVAKGAEVAVVNKQGFTPKDEAARWGYKDVAEVLRRAELTEQTPRLSGGQMRPTSGSSTTPVPLRSTGEVQP